MIQAINISLAFGGRTLYKEVNLKFTKGNCYGIIGANGAGKSTFLKILTGEIEPNKGEVIIDAGKRMSVLVQNQNAFDDETVLIYQYEETEEDVALSLIEDDEEYEEVTNAFFEIFNDEGDFEAEEE